MATFEFKCKHCSQKMEADESMIGQTAECPACGQSLQIEKPASPESPNRKFLPVEDKNPLPPPPASRNSASPGKSVLLLLVGDILLVNLLLLIVTVWPNSWEYKAVKVRGNLTKYEKLENFFPKELEEESLTGTINLYFGKWELVGTVTEIETVHPNFGKEDYVTGIQPNTRTSGTILIFRRRKLF